MKEKLKPCPWCNKSKLRVFKWGITTHYVECLILGCRSSGPIGETPGQAIEKWNGIVGRDSSAGK